MSRPDLEEAREALATAEEAYGRILDSFEEYVEALEEDGPEAAGDFAPLGVGEVEGAILDFREAIGDPDPDVRLAAIGRAFLQAGFENPDGIGDVVYCLEAFIKGQLTVADARAALAKLGVKP